jgi:hypothetical protein
MKKKYPVIGFNHVVRHTINDARRSNHRIMYLKGRRRRCHWPLSKRSGSIRYRCASTPPRHPREGSADRLVPILNGNKQLVSLGYQPLLMVDKAGLS